MSSLVISGDTSGSVTLQAPATAGSTVLTLPATSGTVITSASGTAATATNIAGGSNGTIPYQSASGTTQMLAVGTAGQLLQTNGAGAPTWVTASSGALVFLSTVTASASATVDIETTFSSTYDAYLLVGTSVTVATDSAPICCRMKIGGTYITTTTYVFHGTQLISSSASYASGVSSGANAIQFLDNVGNVANEVANFSMIIYNPSNTTFSKMITWNGGALSETGAQYSCMGSGHNTGTGALTGIRIFTNGNGNIASGTFRLYGIANS